MALARQCVILADWYSIPFASARKPDADENKVGARPGETTVPGGRQLVGSGFQFCQCVDEHELPRANNVTLTHMLLRCAIQLLQHFFKDAPFF